MRPVVSDTYKTDDELRDAIDGVVQDSMRETTPVTVLDDKGEQGLLVDLHGSFVDGLFALVKKNKVIRYENDPEQAVITVVTQKRAKDWKRLDPSEVAALQRQDGAATDSIEPPYPQYAVVWVDSTDKRCVSLFPTREAAKKEGERLLVEVGIDPLDLALFVSEWKPVKKKVTLDLG